MSSLRADMGGFHEDADILDTVSIYNALTGGRLYTNGFNFTNLDSLKLFIAKSFSMSVDNLFLLTPFGIKFKFSMLVHDEINEIFVFDRKFFNPNLVNSDLSETMTSDLLHDLGHDELINMIRPLSAPIDLPKMDDVIDGLLQVVKSTDIDFGSLRLLLNSLKRTYAWASALLSDFKSTLFDEKMIDGNEQVENMLTSLNVLIQYVNLMFKGVEKRFNGLIDEFIVVRAHSLHENWKLQYDKLGQIKFYLQQNPNQLMLIDLVDGKTASDSAFQAELLIKQINSGLATLRTKLESEIIIPKQELVKEYDYYRLQYVKKTADKDAESKLASLYKADFKALQQSVTQLMSSSKELPSFEDLITTENGSSTNLSRASLLKIELLVQLYHQQVQDFVPQIEELSKKMYESQIKRFELRRKLQEKLVKSTLVTLVDLQLKTMEANKILNESIGKRMDQLKEHELGLSFIFDLPLVFGIWLIANLGNVKHGLCLNKLVHKSGEVFEMMRYMEQEDRKKWLEEFVEGVGIAKGKSKWMDDTVKKKFVDENTVDVKVERIGSKSISIVPETGNYLHSFNKLLQHINGHPSRVGPAEAQVINQDEQGPRDIFIEICTQVQVDDVFRYIISLQNEGVDSEVIDQLIKYLNDLGIVEQKEGDVRGDRFGSFNGEDPCYMKFLKRYLKSFEIGRVKIEIKGEEEGVGEEKIGKIGLTEPTEQTSKSLIKGYENRIRKLENLLHQETFKQFNAQWSHKPKQMEFNREKEIVENEHKLINLPPSHPDEKLDKLERENKNLKVKLEELERQGLEELRKEKADIDLELEMAKKENSEKEKNIVEMAKDLKGLKEDKLQLNKKYGDLKSMNDDLLENLTQKESEFNKESQMNQQELNELKLKLEELEETNIELGDKLEEKERRLEGVDRILGELSGRLCEDLGTFCLILESMGLLVVKEEGKMTIKRVKGLRGRKKEIATRGGDETMQIVAEDVVEEAKKRLEEVDEDMNIKYMEFRSLAYLDSKMVVEKVFRRFNDVETLARRLQKEKSQQKGDMKALSEEMSQRLAIRDFKVGDLVLFLKTLSNTAGNPEQPWAVFNIGSPNHYLKNEKDDSNYIDLNEREWFVGRIEKITSKTVTERSYNDVRENPFKLSVGFTWHYVSAKASTTDREGLT
ncbi:hypothetical protein FOA43_002966 [Brettanomyces nanus]|uniref:Autophagy-related protein 11 n=1 Tax=Eeniella nana TaxID=13502 RepID=A0A875S7C3_EENNA|nr:uncharacterized protein FOA43_002966 [Brettanomyces nanus]QPG75609.1 hypothetical protein FOA43_002966 [Brettanomyces nanus]